MQLSLVRPSPGGDGVPEPAVPWPSGGSPLPPAHPDFYPRVPHQGCEPPGPVHEGKWGPGRAGHSARAGFGDTRWGHNFVPPLRQLMGAADFHIVALDYRGTATPCPSLSHALGTWGPSPRGCDPPRRVPYRLWGLQRVPHRERLHHRRPGTLRLGQGAEWEQQHHLLGTLLGDRVGVGAGEGHAVGAPLSPSPLFLLGSQRTRPESCRRSEVTSRAGVAACRSPNFRGPHGSA